MLQSANPVRWHLRYVRIVSAEVLIEDIDLALDLRCTDVLGRIRGIVHHVDCNWKDEDAAPCHAARLVLVCQGPVIDQ
jgi:hypothetical protein